MLAQLDDSAQDHGPRSAAASTTRLCVATREVKPVGRMIRFVIGPNRIVVPDLKRKLPGRGVWVTARRDVVADAVSRYAFRRGFKGEVEVSKNLPTVVEQLLERSVLDALAIANKASAVVAGFAKVETAIEAANIVALIHAADASADGCRKLTSAAKRRFGGGSEAIVTMTGFASTQLDLALGRSNVIHAALLAERASDTVLSRWRLLDYFRTDDPDCRSDQKQTGVKEPQS
jgi:uncharacterized protein